MPIYDYRCDHCGDFRERRPLSESHVSAPCPGCAAPSPRRLVAPFLASKDGGGAVTQSPRDRLAGHVCSHGCGH